MNAIRLAVKVIGGLFTASMIASGVLGNVIASLTSAVIVLFICGAVYIDEGWTGSLEDLVPMEERK